MNTIKLVDTFWQSMELPRPAQPTIPDTKGYLMVTHLVSEEHGEFCKALLDQTKAEEILKEYCDLRYVVLGAFIRYGMFWKAEEYEWLEDIDEAFDSPLAGHECLQLGLQLLTEGTDVFDLTTCEKGLNQMLFGVNLLGHNLIWGTDVLDAAFAEVHAANMTKLNSDGTPCKDETGRIMKSPNSRPANMSNFTS